MITYDGLPLSAGGAHRLGRLGWQEIWDAVEAFFATFTVPVEPESLELLLYGGGGLDDAFSGRARDVISEAFGPPGRRPKVGGRQGTITEDHWTVPDGVTAAALALLQRSAPIPQTMLGGQLVLSRRRVFHLADPATRQPLPGQGPGPYGGQEAQPGLQLGRSYLSLRLSNPSTCAAFLSLPFDEVTDGLRRYVSDLQEALPFRFSKAHWALWRPNAAGTRRTKRGVTVL